MPDDLSAGKSPESDPALVLPALAGGTPVRSPENAIVFGAPVMDESDVLAISECIRSGWIGTGGRVRRFEEEFAAYKRAPFAVAVSSGTAALHLALVALGIAAGDEVIVPTMTFCSPVHSILHTGATPVFADCDPRTFNLAPESVEKAITSRTRAILVAHLCGRCSDMDALMDIARRHNVRVIEDCAHAIESTYRGQPAGLIGDVGCFSFYATKNVTCGDGGMLITKDRQLARRVRVLGSQGMLRDAWSRRNSSSGSRVVALGFKYNMTDIEAALGVSQLSALEERWARRKRLWELYDELLQELPLQLPLPASDCSRHAYHLYTPLLELERLSVPRRTILRALRAENIGTGIHYAPVHELSYYRARFRIPAAAYPAAHAIGARTLSLPLTGGMTDQAVHDVCRALSRILTYYAA